MIDNDFNILGYMSCNSLHVFHGESSLTFAEMIIQYTEWHVSLLFQTGTHYASLDPDGNIAASDGRIFAKPLHWCISINGVKNMKNITAFKTVSLSFHSSFAFD